MKKEKSFFEMTATDFVAPKIFKGVFEEVAKILNTNDEAKKVVREIVSYGKVCAEAGKFEKFLSELEKVLGEKKSRKGA